jgi:hypothetical protein
MTVAMDSMLWASIARDETILVQCNVKDAHDASVLDIARELLNRDPSCGWDTYAKPFRPWHKTNKLSNVSASYKGLRFHVYETVPQEKPRMWVFACVYDADAASKRLAQIFLEKIVMISETVRNGNDAWTRGGDYACEELFGPVLRQHMQEIAVYGPEMEDMMGSLAYANHCIQRNKLILDEHKNREKEQKIKLAHEERLRRQMEPMNTTLLTHGAPMQDSLQRSLHGVKTSGAVWSDAFKKRGSQLGSLLQSKSAALQSKIVDTSRHKPHVQINARVGNMFNSNIITPPRK